MRNKLIILLTGKACQAFKLFSLISQEYGHLTLGELAKDSYKYGYWILWEAEK